MQKLHFTISINAPKKKVWHAMLDDETYKQWTDVFATGSHYKGNWEKDSKILFLAPEIEYDMDDKRHVKKQFTQVPEGIMLTEIFDPENVYPKDMQRSGWQAILNNFKKYVEGSL